MALQYLEYELPDNTLYPEFYRTTPNMVFCMELKLWVTRSYCFHLYNLALLDVGALRYFELRILLQVLLSVYKFYITTPNTVDVK